jgi:hypothetical protein
VFSWGGHQCSCFQRWLVMIPDDEQDDGDHDDDDADDAKPRSSLTPVSLVGQLLVASLRPMRPEDADLGQTGLVFAEFLEAACRSGNRLGPLCHPYLTVAGENPAPCPRGVTYGQ